MIATLGVEGYRAFREPTSLSLRRLTVIFGKNNSGKTTLTRSPLFIGASLHRPELYTLVTGRQQDGSSSEAFLLGRVG
jgi:predicted ATPase